MTETTETWIWPTDQHAIICVDGPFSSWGYDPELFKEVQVEFWKAWPIDNPQWKKVGSSKEEAVGKVFLDMAHLPEDPKEF